MLELIRRYSDSIVVKIFLTLLAGSFFLFFGFSYVIDKLRGRDYLVKISNIKISPQQFKFEKTRKLELLRRRDFTEINESEVTNTILHQIIWENLINLAADEFGIVVSDSTMYNYISNMDIFRTKDGHFDAANLRRFLHSIQVPEPVFLESSKREIKIHLMQAPFRFISFVDELPYYSKINCEKRSLKFVSLKPSSFKVEEKPTNEELEEFYNNNSDKFMIPEKRSFLVLELSHDEVEKKMAFSQVELREEARELYGEDVSDWENFTKTEGYKQLKREKVQAAAEEKARLIEDALVSGNSPEKVAIDYNLKAIKVTDVALDDVRKVPLPYGKDVLTVAFGQDEKEVGNFTEALNAQKKTVQWLVYVNNIKPKHVEKFSKAEKSVKKAWVESRQHEMAVSMANYLSEQIAAGEEFSKATFKKGYKIRKTPLFDRFGKLHDKKKDKIIENVYDEAFKKTRNDVSVKEIDGEIVVYQLDKIEYDEEAAEKNRSIDYKNLKEDVANDMYQQLIGFLSKRYEVKINYEKLKETDDAINLKGLEDIL